MGDARRRPGDLTYPSRGLAGAGGRSVGEREDRGEKSPGPGAGAGGASGGAMASVSRRFPFRVVAAAAAAGPVAAVSGPGSGYAADEFYVLNTHLDHANQYSRERSAGLINERLGDLDPSLPRIVTGDFNVAAHKNSVYEMLLDGGSLVDSWDTADERSRQYATFHGYRPLVPDGDRVDWILTSPGLRTRRATINTYSAHGQFPSDHLPVQALLDW
ncbi:endonuclease/exonuclease/phosphatase family protein [Streptomyces platensis]|uniref:endonuclease/exonuclease/phosphatase family protein n=1 Tax=Streptomyces platensis TaxID=58346 RepID=UPI00379F8357